MVKKKNNQELNDLTIPICMKQVDMVDYYITKNILKMISNKKNFEFVKSNIFLLSINNLNNKNSLIILLENGKYDIIDKLINHDYNILNYKNIDENNLFKSMLCYNYFYDFIANLISNLEKNFIINIITFQNTDGKNFIDNLITLLNLNDKYYYNNSDDDKKILLNKLINIAYCIYLLDSEKHTLLITKLSKVIFNQVFLLDIFKKFNIDNFDIFHDDDLLTCIDYLIINEHLEVLLFLLDKVNYIEFTNFYDNIVFKFCENNNINLNIKSNILIQILNKSNIAKLKNNKNQNIFYWLISNYQIDVKTLINFKDYINIYEQDINGKSLFYFIKNKYCTKDLKIIKKTFYNQFIDEKVYFLTYKKINLKKKLIKSDIGIFTSNVVHNMLYTLYILNNNQKIIKIPNHKLTNNDIQKYKELIGISNNEINYIDIYFSFFNKWLPHLIVWKNKYNYFIDRNLLSSIQENNKIRFIYIKLSLYIKESSSVRHSNVLILDNIEKTVERFEPYGEMIYTSSNDINDLIITQIANPLGYKFIFIQPYPGFQSRSDEYAKFNKSYGDPMGFCLAWSFLYIDIKMELFKNKIKINPIDFINWYIINKFNEDFNIDYNINKTNKYILFIRYYSRYLDLKKNEIIKKFKLDSSIIYQQNLDNNYMLKLVDCINNELNLYL